MNRALALVRVSLALVFLLANPSSVLAATIAEDAEVGVQLWLGAQPGETIVIVSAEVPTETPLPVTVRLPIAPGMNVDWAGEISGQAPEQDIARKYETKNGKGGQYAEFTLEKYRQCQIELSGIAITAKGTSFSTAVQYVQTSPAPLTGFSVRMLPGAENVRIQPAPVDEPSKNQVGEALYTLPSKEMKAGDKITISVSYGATEEPAEEPTDQAGGQPIDQRSVIVTILVLLAAAIVALVFVMGRQRTNHADAGDEQQ